MYWFSEKMHGKFPGKMSEHGSFVFYFRAGFWITIFTLENYFSAWSVQIWRSQKNSQKFSQKISVLNNFQKVSQKITFWKPNNAETDLISCQLVIALYLVFLSLLSSNPSRFGWAADWFTYSAQSPQVNKQGYKDTKGQLPWSLESSV